MANENTQSQNVPPTADGAAEAAIATAEQIKFFGADMVGEGVPATPVATEEKKDDPKPEPTSVTAPAPSAQEKRKLAGKYETQEALEKGYEEQQTYLSTIKREKAELERQMAVLMKAGGAGTQQAAGTTPTGAPAGTTQKNPQVQAIIDQAREVGGDEVSDMISKLVDYYDSKLGAQGNATGLDSADPIAITLKQFSEEYPEFAEGPEADKFSVFLAEVAKNTDPMAQLDLCRRAYLQQTEAERMDKLILETTKKVTEARDKYWKSAIYSGSVTLGASAPGSTAQPDEQKAEQARYFGADMVQ